MLPRPLYRVVFAIGVTTFLVAFGLGIVQAWQNSGRLPELPYDELGQGRDALALGDVETAKRQLRTYALLQPDKSDGWMRLGAFLQGNDDRRGAIEAFERALKTLPQPLNAYQSLAVLYYQEGDAARARAYGQVAVQNGADLPPDVRQHLGL